MAGDPRFKNVEDKDREDIFQDYLDDLLIKEREDKRLLRYFLDLSSFWLPLFFNTQCM